jgi:hypothetical protein
MHLYHWFLCQKRIFVSMSTPALNSKVATSSSIVFPFCNSKTLYSAIFAILFAVISWILSFSKDICFNFNTRDSSSILLLTSSMNSYPPTLSTNQRNELLTTSIDWGSAHGLVVGAPNGPVQRLVHAPFALLPSPFPRGCFEEAHSLQVLFNELMDRVVRDDEFLTEIFERYID